MDIPLTFHIVGDAYVDMFCFLEGDLPESGGDSRLEQPIRQYAGGSSTNTATHLHSLTNHFFEEHYHGNGVRREQAEDAEEKEDEKEETSNKKEKNDETPEPDASEAASSTAMTVNKPIVLLHTVFNELDSFGQLLKKHGETQGFEIQNCYQPINDSSGNQEQLSTGHCVAIVSGGERSFMTHQGCVGTFSADHLDLRRIIGATPAGQAQNQQQQHIHVHVAGYFNVEGFHHGNLKRALEEIRLERSRTTNTNGGTTTMSLVTQHDASKQWDGGLEQVAPFLDFLIMNELEANSILKSHGQTVDFEGGADDGAEEGVGGGGGGGIFNSAAQLNAYVQAWLHYFSSWEPTTCVIVTLGAQGAVAFRNHKIMATLLPAVKVQVVDPTGAGDSFTAGFLHGLWGWKQRQQQQQQQGTASSVAMPTTTTTVGGLTFQKLEWPAQAIQQGLLWGCAVGTSAVTIRGASNPAPPETIRNYYQQQQQQHASRGETMRGS